MRIEKQDSEEQFVDKLYAMLMALDSTERAHAYVQANSWKWPGALADVMPDGFELLTHDEKFVHPKRKQLWRVLEATTSEFERSRQWWREKLNATDDDHLKWWRYTFT